MYTTKKQFKVQIISILEEVAPIDQKCTNEKVKKKLGMPPSPHLDKIQKNGNSFRETVPYIAVWITFDLDFKRESDSSCKNWRLPLSLRTH